MPIQNASSSHPPLVAMVIVAEPGLHLASPARAERPLSCPRGFLGSEAGLPGAVTHHRPGKGGEGLGWHRDMAQLQGGSTLGVSKRGRKNEGNGRQNGSPDQEEGDLEETEGTRRREKFGHTLSDIRSPY